MNTEITKTELIQALKDLTKEIQLHKLNIRKDFSLMNAHACACKAIYMAEQALDLPKVINSNAGVTQS